MTNEKRPAEADRKEVKIFAGDWCYLHSMRDSRCICCYMSCLGRNSIL